MRRIAYCAAAALITCLTACEAQKSANEGEPANEAGQPASKPQPANEAQSAPTAAAAKCREITTQLPVEVSDLTRKTYACVERNALLYSKGPDSIEALSKAVIAKCKDAIVQYVDQESKKVGQKPQYKEPLESWQGHASAIIAEARARRCT